MLFTPYHFIPHATVAFSLHRHIDIPVFILTNVIIDLEPLIVMLINLNYHIHGYAHTFVGAAILGAIWGFAGFLLKGISQKLNASFKLRYSTTM